nr:hypothetical protein [uncultured bacterium]
MEHHVGARGDQLVHVVGRCPQRGGRRYSGALGADQVGRRVADHDRPLGGHVQQAQRVPHDVGGRFGPGDLVGADDVREKREQSQAVEQRARPRPALAGGDGEAQATHPQCQQQFGHAVEHLHLVGEAVALADEGLLHRDREVHDPHDVREVAAQVVPVLLERRGPVADDLGVGDGEGLAHHRVAVDDDPVQVEDDGVPRGRGQICDGVR